MQKDGYMNVSAKLGSDELGLGWLTGVTVWRTSKAVSMASHRHPHIELLFCLKGNLIYEIEGYGSVTVSEGTGIMIPSDTQHILRDGTDSPCERLGLHIAKTLARTRKFGVYTPADYRSIHSTLVSMAVHPFRLDSRLQSSVRELATLTYDDTRKAAALGFIRALCCTIIYRTAETLTNPPVPIGPQMMDEAVRFLEENHSRKIGIEDLARRMGYGRTQLFHLFKRHTGLTPNEYLVRYRIKRAKELVSNSSMPLSKIARSTGFSSESYFRSVFLKYTGRTLDSFGLKTRSN